VNSAGLDVGSRTIEIVVLDARKNAVIQSLICETGIDPLGRCREILSGREYERLVVTGYGRHLVAPALGGRVISEIRAYAVGAKRLFPDCRTVIDIGGQDSKVMLLDADGAVQKFEMNDRCAAGTGKFLEVIAGTMGMSVGELGELGLSAARTIQINSLCTVFADSEVVSLIARGEDPAAIALGLQEAVATRIAGMARRVGVKDRVIFAGGGALNRCLRQLLGDKLEAALTVPDEPQFVGALGAALVAGHEGTGELPESG
jgi:(R)-2-hydroxyacyl-CoA dehydratese activating ATPase